MASKSRPSCGASQIIENGASTFHRCRQCREHLCSILCSAFQEEEEFLCFPCHNSQQKQASSHKDKENEHPQQEQEQHRSSSQTTPTPAKREIQQKLETPTFRPGDLVEVAPNGKSFGGKAWVTAVSHTPGGHATYDAKYILPTSKRFTPNVPLKRLDTATLEPSARIRSSDAAALVKPSLLSRNHIPTTTNNANEQKRKSTNGKLTTVHRLLKDAHEWSKKKNGIHPIEKFLKRNASRKNFQKGYLRERQAKDERREDFNQQKRLTEHEWTLVIKMRDSLEARQVDQKDKFYSPFGDFAKAWGISHQALNRKRKRVLDDICTSQKKREEVYTPYQIYKPGK